MKEQTFPAVTREEWKQAARSSLKGKPLSELYTETAENIELKPLYTKADTKGGQSSLPGEKPFTRGFDRLGTFPKTEIKLAIDPVSEGAAAGVFPSKEVLAHIHNQPFITINTVPYHMAGANAVQELAVALSEAVFYMKMASNKNEVVSKMIVHFAAGPRFFTEIAKIRAFRTLWSAVMDVYELDERSKPSISVETSEQTLSVLDPHVNILRTGSAAFSAVLGNIDYLHVFPFNQVTRGVTELSERIARNIPLLLKHEAHLDKVTDPAGGSYYIESLTNEIGRMAWDEFAGIEEAGGIEHVLKAGTIQKEIAAVQMKREKEIATRRQLLIGTNIYANMTEEDEYAPQKTNRLTIDGEKIVTLMPKRLAEPFEQLRQKAAAIEQTGKSVKAGVICLGTLKTNKPRTDYVVGILAVGGIQVVLSETIETVKEAVRFVETNDFPYYCICGADSTYEQFGSEFVEELRKVSGEAVIDAAGKWQVTGLDGFISAGDNIVDKLWALLSLYEGGTEQ